MDQIQLVQFKKNKRIYSLDDSFNVIISGKVKD